MRHLRPVLLLLFLGALGWFEFAQPLTAAALLRRGQDLFDGRPARHILVLGNSRTYYNDMPDMIRAMADSAGDPAKLQIELDAQPGASFESLWDDAGTQRLLGQTWDDVILQGESRAQAREAANTSFQHYGAALIRAARVRSGAPRLVVNWNYDAAVWGDTDPDGSGHAAYDATIQSSTQALGAATGARLVNVGRLWAEVIRDHPDIALTEDGNHPTVAGSYLFALILYADLSKRDVGAVTYVPQGLDPGVAATLRRAVEDDQAFAG